MGDKKGLTIIEVLISFAFVTIFVSLAFNMMGFVQKNGYNNIKELSMSNILLNKMEETKANSDTDCGLTIEDIGEFILTTHINPLDNMGELYEIIIEIVGKDRQHEDRIISYFSNIINYDPQIYNEIPINMEDVTILKPIPNQ